MIYEQVLSKYNDIVTKCVKKSLDTFRIFPGTSCFQKKTKRKKQRRRRDEVRALGDGGIGGLIGGILVGILGNGNYYIHIYIYI